MDAFGIEQGDCGAGTGRYAAGLITLPDGTVRGVETVTRVEIRPETGSDESLQRASRTTSEVAGSFRDALGATKAASPTLPLPLRLAVSTMRAGLGAIEQGLRPREAVAVAVEIGFADGAATIARMPPETAALIRRDAEIARGALERARPAGAGSSAPPSPDTAPDEALTSIFRYEKRNGRLRRVAASGKPED